MAYGLFTKNVVSSGYEHSRPLLELTMKLSESFSGPRRARNVRRYVSLCKLCGETIFADEARTWLTNPMGLSHERCVPDV